MLPTQPDQDYSGTQAELAEFLDVDIKTVSRWRQRGLLRHWTIGRVIRIPEEAIIQAIVKRPSGPGRAEAKAAWRAFQDKKHASPPAPIPSDPNLASLLAELRDRVAALEQRLQPAA